MTRLATTKWSRVAILGALIMLGLILRLPSLKMGIWRDEAASIFVARASDLSQFITYMTEIEYSPPGYFLVLYLHDKLFGTNEIIAQFPSIAFSLLLVPAVCFLTMLTMRMSGTGSAHQRETAGLLGALFAAVSPQNVYFSHEARPYAMVAFLNVVSLLLFFKAGHCGNKRRRVLFLAGWTIVNTVLIYTQYLTILLFAAYGASLVYLLVRRDSRFPFLPFAGSLAISSLLFLPWAPITLTQMKQGVPWDEKTPLLLWPEVAVHNLASTLPFPYVPAFLITLCLIVPFLLFLGARMFWNSRKSPGRILTIVPSPYVVLSAVLFLPVSVLGFITPFYKGYFRYMFPFSPVSWILQATALTAPARLSETAGAAEADSGAAEGSAAAAPAGAAPARPNSASSSLSGRHGLLLLSVASLVTVADIAQAISFGGMAKSGARQIAKEVLSGAFDNTAVIVAPDFDTQTLTYYLGGNKLPERGIEVHGFALWDATTPFKPRGYGELWANPNLIEDTMRRIENLPAGRTRLALVRDSRHNPETAKMKSRSLTDLLIEHLKARYELVETRHYDGVTETYDLYLFDREHNQKGRG